MSDACDMFLIHIKIEFDLFLTVPCHHYFGDIVFMGSVLWCVHYAGIFF